MSRELYLRTPSDPNYQLGIIETSDEIEMIISQIKMILLTKRGDVLGAPDFGLDLEEMLFTFDATETGIRSALTDQIVKFCPMAEKFNINYDIKFGRGTVRDICIIDILIDGRAVFGVFIK